MKIFVIKAITFYRNYLSINKMQCCRFYPSCSAYAIEAIEKHGLLPGLVRGAKRLLRCHPFSQGGYDPV